LKYLEIRQKTRGNYRRISKTNPLSSHELALIGGDCYEISKSTTLFSANKFTAMAPEGGAGEGERRDWKKFFQGAVTRSASIDAYMCMCIRVCTYV